MNKRGRREKIGTRWEEEKRKFFRDRGLELDNLDKWREKNEGGFEELVRRDKEMQRTEILEKIRESQFNKWYKKVKGIGIPSYLKKG